jgi:hypothetical protein
LMSGEMRIFGPSSIFDVSSTKVGEWFPLRVAREDFGFLLVSVKVPGLM